LKAAMTVEVFECCIKGQEIAPAYTEQNDPIEIVADLRALFFIRGDEVVSFDIGTHDVYRR